HRRTIREPSRCARHTELLLAVISGAAVRRPAGRPPRRHSGADVCGVLGGSGSLRPHCGLRRESRPRGARDQGFGGLRTIAMSSSRGYLYRRLAAPFLAILFFVESSNLLMLGYLWRRGSEETAGLLYGDVASDLAGVLGPLLLRSENYGTLATTAFRFQLMNP